MMKNYYEILGISKNATVSEIKNTYRKLAKKWHPDINKMPQAHNKFVEIAEAYEVLKDNTKRAAYDKIFEFYQSSKENTTYTDVNTYNEFLKWTRQANNSAEKHAKMSYKDFVLNVFGIITFSLFYWIKLFFTIALNLFIIVLLFSGVKLLIIDRHVWTLALILPFLFLNLGLNSTIFGSIINIRKNYRLKMFDNSEIINDESRIKRMLPLLTTGIIATGIFLFYIIKNFGTTQCDNYLECQSINAHQMGDVFLDFNPNNHCFVSGSDDGTVCIFDAEKRKMIDKIYKGVSHICAVEFSKDGKFIAIGRKMNHGVLSDDNNNSVLIYSMELQDFIKTIHSKDNVNGFDFSNDNNMFAFTVGMQVFLFKLPEFEPVDTLGYSINQYIETARDFEEKHDLLTLYRNSEFKAVKFSPDNTHIAACGKEIILWNIENKNIEKRFSVKSENINSIDFSSDGKNLSLAGGDNPSVMVIDVKTGNELCRHTESDIFDIYGFTEIRFSVDDMLLYASDKDNNYVRVFNASTCKPTCALRGHKENVTSFAISTDSEYIVSGDWHGVIKIWKKTNKN